MAFCRVQVALVNDSLLPRDEAQNVWHFNTPNDVATDGPDIVTVLTNFYNTAHQNILFSNLLTGGLRFKLYDLADPEPRPPLYDVTGTLTGTLGAAYPAEVAVCLSMQGPVIAGVPQARRRGRLYLGPISTAAGAAGTGDLRVAVSARQDIAEAAEDLMTQVVLPGLVWSVYSPTIDATGSLAASFTTVTNGFINDAFDTQRRRGLAPTTRTVFP